MAIDTKIIPFWRASCITIAKGSTLSTVDILILYHRHIDQVVEKLEQYNIICSTKVQNCLIKNIVKKLEYFNMRNPMSASELQIFHSTHNHCDRHPMPQIYTILAILTEKNQLACNMNLSEAKYKHIALTYAIINLVQALFQPVTMFN